MSVFPQRRPARGSHSPEYIASLVTSGFSEVVPPLLSATYEPRTAERKENGIRSLSDVTLHPDFRIEINWSRGVPRFRFGSHAAWLACRFSFSLFGGLSYTRSKMAAHSAAARHS